MPSTNFISLITIIEASWLNEVDDYVFNQIVPGGGTVVTEDVSGDISVTNNLTVSGALFAGTITANPALNIDSDATGNPFLQFQQNGTDRAYLQYLDTGDELRMQNALGDITFYPGNTLAMTLDGSPLAARFHGSITVDGTSFFALDGTDGLSVTIRHLGSTNNPGIFFSSHEVNNDATIDFSSTGGGTEAILKNNGVEWLRVDASQGAKFTRNLTAGDGTQVSVQSAINASATGNPALRWQQGGVNRAYAQYLNAGDEFRFQNGIGDITFYPGNTLALTLDNATRDALFQRNVTVGDGTQSNPLLDIESTATGQPAIRWLRNAAQAAFIQYLNSNDALRIDGDGPIELYPANAPGLTLDSTEYTFATGSRLVAGDDTSINGGSVIEGHYSGANRHLVLGSLQSSGATALMRSVRSDPVTADGFESSNALATNQQAFYMDGNGFHFVNATAATPAIGTDVAMTERFRITGGGNVSIASGGRLYFDGVVDTYMVESAADRLDTYVAGVLNMRIQNGSVTMGSYVFDTDQVLGAGQDNYVLTYDNAGGQVSLEALPVFSNADTLDSLDSTQFLRSDVAATQESGALTLGDQTQASPTLTIVSTAAGSPRLTFSQTASNRAFIEYTDVGDIFTLSTGGSVEIITSSTTAIDINSSGQCTFAENITANRNLTVGNGVQFTPQITIDSNATGNPLLEFSQAGTQKAFMQYRDAGDFLKIDSDGEIHLFPSSTLSAEFSTTQAVLGNMAFNIDQTIGAGQDNYVLTYNNATGEIGLEGVPSSGGSSPWSYTLQTGTTYTAAAGDFVVASNTGSVTITLPTGHTADDTIIVKKTGASGTVTIDANGAETIDGALTKALTAQYQSFTLISDGTNWLVV